MRVRNNMLELTWREDLRGGPALLGGVPFWKRAVAPIQHWLAVWFRGHRSFDPCSFSNFSAFDVPGTGAPAPTPIDVPPPGCVFTGDRSVGEVLQGDVS